MRENERERERDKGGEREKELVGKIAQQLRAYQEASQSPVTPAPLHLIPLLDSMDTHMHVCTHTQTHQNDLKLNKPQYQ